MSSAMSDGVENKKDFSTLSSIRAVVWCPWDSREKKAKKIPLTSRSRNWINLWKSKRGEESQESFSFFFLLLLAVVCFAFHYFATVSAAQHGCVWVFSRVFIFIFFPYQHRTPHSTSLNFTHFPSSTLVSLHFFAFLSLVARVCVSDRQASSGSGHCWCSNKKKKIERTVNNSMKNLRNSKSFWMMNKFFKPNIFRLSSENFFMFYDNGRNKAAKKKRKWQSSQS